jgi:hypothetical protein
MIKIPFGGLLIGVIFSCNINQSAEVTKQNGQHDSIQVDIPANNKELSKATEFYKKFQIKNRQLVKQRKIDSLIVSFDSLHIRLWNIDYLFGSRDLYEIFKSNSVCKGYYYLLKTETKYSNGQGDREYLSGPVPMEIEEVKEIQPKHGWKKFIDSLNALKIFTLPDMDEIPQMEIKWTHPNWTFVEISAIDHFRFYGYADPNRFSDKFWQANNIEKIKYLFYSEFLK